MTEDQGRNKASGTATPDAAWVRAHLSHVLADSEFAAAPQLSAFLTYIIERKLEGAQDRIKAYTIATEALGRPESFDPQSDPIVRVQARRLRQALQAYYAQPHADDTLRISLPVGGYVPEFTSYVSIVRHGGDRVDAHGARPVRHYALAALAVALLALAITVWSSLPALRNSWDQYTWQQPPTEANPLGMPALTINVASERLIPAWFQPAQFVKGLEFNLSRFDEFVIMAPRGAYTSTRGDYRLDLDFTGITGTVLGTARLSKAGSGRIVWTQTFNVLEGPITRYALLLPARQLASTLGQPYGVLYSQLLGDPEKTEDQACLLKGYEWFQNPVKEDIEPTRRCIEDLLQRHPGNHIAYILLGYLYTERYRNRLGTDPGGDLTQAYTMARRSVALRPQSAGSQQVLMEVQSARGNEDLALEAGRKALDLNPNDSDVLADYGCRLIYRGRYDEGGSYAKQAAELNDLPPPWHLFCLFVAANNTGQDAEADTIARRLDGEAGPFALIPVIIAAHRRGDTARAQSALRELVAYEPRFSDDPAVPLALLGIFPETAAPLIAGLKAAGLKPLK